MLVVHLGTSTISRIDGHVWCNRCGRAPRGRRFRARRIQDWAGSVVRTVIVIMSVGTDMATMGVRRQSNCRERIMVAENVIFGDRQLKVEDV